MYSRSNEPLQPGQNVSLLIDGESISDGSKHTVQNPHDQREVWSYTTANAENANQAIEAAQAAFPAWSNTNPATRGAILQQAAKIFLERSEELAQYMKLETAASDAFIEFNISATTKQLKDIGSRATAVQGFFPSIEDDARSALILKEPYGVILGIAPWSVRQSFTWDRETDFYA